MTRHAVRVVAASAGCVLGLCLVAVATSGAGGEQSPTQSSALDAYRVEMLERYREAARHAQRADAADLAAASRTVVVRDLAATLAALGSPAPADDGSGAPSIAPGTPSPASLLPAAERQQLRQAARALETIADDAAAMESAGTFSAARTAQHVDTRALSALLDRVRTLLEGEIALGLTFQGTYSQTRAPEPVLGGHATAMGPAPSGPGAGAAGSAAESPSTSIRFEERIELPTRTWAGGPTKDHILESAGNGVVLFDYDGDGLLDIYLVTAAQLTPDRTRVAHRNALYRNLGNWQFEDVSARAGVDGAAWGSGACVGDVDADGHLDLYVTNWGRNFLYRNRGDGTFDEVAEQSGVAAGGWSTGCAFLDANGDGRLDLYVSRYVRTSWNDLLHARRTLTWRNGPNIMVGPAGLPAESDLFFENVGDGQFREVSEERGLGEPVRAYGFAVVATDYDDDGHVDLFVANDSNPNLLYRNLGNGHFESVGLVAGVGVNSEARAQAGMGADAGDVSGDGLPDIVLTAFAHDRNSLYRNLGGGLFEDASVAVGLAGPTFTRMGWGVAFLDADLDGWLDLFVANGHIFADIDDHPDLGESFSQKNQILTNTDGRFRDVSDAAGPGLQVAKVSRGLAIGDLDNDGDPDVVVSNMDDTPTVLENRQQTGHHWVGFRVTAPQGNRFAIGAKVTVEAGGHMQVREIRSGASYLSQHDLRPLFGLGSHAGAISVTVRMPGGTRWHWSGLAVDRYHDLLLSPAAQVAPAPGER